MTTMLKNNNHHEYSFVSLSKVIGARILDYLLVSLIIFVISWSIYQSQHLTGTLKAVINHFIVLSLLVIYFIFIPYFWHGKTLAKFILRFKLIKMNSRRIRLCDLLYRELVITFVPWTILIISNLIMTWGFKYIVFNFKQQSFFIVKQQNELPLAITIILRSVGLFYLGWYSILIILYKIEKQHQLFFDRHLKIYVVAEPLKLTTKREKDPLITPKIHVHLKENLPGNINDTHLENIDEL